MANLSDDRLDRLLNEAFPAVQVSPDFTLKLWRRLMKQPGLPPWMVPVPVAVLAAAIGIFAGVQTWLEVLQPQAGFPLAQAERLDLFGNAPVDSLAGTYLKLDQGA